MRRITFVVCALCLLTLAGCEEGMDYTTTCDIKKVDGKANIVTVTLPHHKKSKPTELVFKDRQQVQNMIDALDSLKLDLELARDQMSFPEL